MTNKSTRAVMVDIETLDTTRTAVVLQIAAVAFDYDAKGKVKVVSEFDVCVPVDTQLESGRTISADTVKWWLSDISRAGVYAKLISRSVDEANDGATDDWASKSFKEWLEFQDFREIWSQGPTFDIIILEDLMPAVPWKFYQVRDLRTVQKFVGDDEKSIKMKAANSDHNALNDCHSQIKLLQHFIKKSNKNG